MKLDQQTWDERLQALGGHLLQSWRWGEFKRQSGWEVDRVSITGGNAMAQVLYRSKGPVSVAYIPRGPAWSGNAQDAANLMQEIDSACRRRRSLYAIVEQNAGLEPEAEREAFKHWAPGPEFIQPGRTVKIALADDETILKQMHQKTRYSVRLAKRKGVEIESLEGLCEDGLATFYSLLEETSQRNQFGVHGEQYYRDFLRVFDKDALILVAKVGGAPAASLIAAAFGNEAIYMYGGSSTEHRSVGAAFLLQFEAMRWARDRGLDYYDLWGIPREDPPAENEPLDAVPATRGDDWRGLLRFKTGFGGEIIDYPVPLERQFSRIGTRLAKQYMRALG